MAFAVFTKWILCTDVHQSYTQTKARNFLTRLLPNFIKNWISGVQTEPKHTPDAIVRQKSIAKPWDG
jgi:hypothetical protein